ncbi:MAG: hypothetical protein Q7T72_11505 [Bacteroidales bacterium]|nr:hypothetical protein [Bacteroidales bacterium]
MENNSDLVCQVNLDYEAWLFDPNYLAESPANLKIIREFEYIFFLTNKENCILKNFKKYDTSYLEKLKKMGFIIPVLNPIANLSDYWWGSCRDVAIERLLNSKITSAKIAKANNWGFGEGIIIENFNDLKLHLKDFPQIKKWIIKRPFSFSGIGHLQFNAKEMNELLLIKSLNEKVLLEPVYDRVFDIGTTFIIENGIIKRQFMVENFNSPSGSFNGGAGSNNVDKFKKYIFQKYSYSLNKLEEVTLAIAQTYLELGARSNIQIDSFVYRENDELKIYALVEVNYRKTMGLVIQSLADKYPEADRIEWKVGSRKKFKINPLDSEWIKLSPEDNHFQSYVRLYL